VVLAGLFAGLGCGGGDSAPAQAAQTAHACSTIADGYARAWERCERLTYDEAKEIFADAFDCEDVQNADGAEVEACLEELDELSCDDVTRGTTPSSCQQVLQD
jgi:hypothetical protein